MFSDRPPEWPETQAAPPLWLLTITGLVLGGALVTLFVADTPRVLWISLAVVLVGTASAALVRWLQSWR